LKGFWADTLENWFTSPCSTSSYKFHFSAMGYGTGHIADTKLQHQIKVLWMIWSDFVFTDWFF